MGADGVADLRPGRQGGVDRCAVVIQSVDFLRVGVVEPDDGLGGQGASEAALTPRLRNARTDALEPAPINLMTSSHRSFDPSGCT